MRQHVGLPRGQPSQLPGLPCRHKRQHAGAISDHLGFYSTASIFSQVDPSWRSYEEFMPAACDHIAMTGSAATGYYVGRHNPADSYSSLPAGAPAAGDCSKLDEPLGTTTSGALQQDVANGTLPEFSFVTPGLCEDMHNFPAGGCRVRG